MGRSKHYRSPSTMKRSSERLLRHLHKMMKILKKMIEQTKVTSKNDINLSRKSNTRESKSNKMNETKIDTFSIHEKDDTLFFTSTPRKPRFFCREYWNEPFKEAGTSKLATDRPHRDWIL